MLGLHIVGSRFDSIERELARIVRDGSIRLRAREESQIGFAKPGVRFGVEDFAANRCGFGERGHAKECEKKCSRKTWRYARIHSSPPCGCSNSDAIGQGRV